MGCILQIPLPGYAGLEDEIIEQADQSPQNSHENYANKLSGKGDDLLEPNDKSRAPGSGGDSRLPEFAKAWKMGN